MTVASCWEFCKGFFLKEPSESLALLRCSNLLIYILLVLGSVCDEFSYSLRIGINTDDLEFFVVVVK